jgi:hypothetical protein
MNVRITGMIRFTGLCDFCMGVVFLSGIRQGTCNGDETGWNPGRRVWQVFPLFAF